MSRTITANEPRLPARRDTSLPAASPGCPTGRADAAASPMSLDAGQFQPSKPALVPGVASDVAPPQQPAPAHPERAATWEALERAGVAYAAFPDETGSQGGIRTNYAVYCRDAGAVVVALDNANGRHPKYEGLSQAERRFTLDVVEFAKRKGLPVLAFAHKPPNTVGRHSSDSPRTRDHRQWIASLRDTIYSNVLFVFGHVHPEPGRYRPQDVDVDLDGARDARADVDAMILGAEVDNAFAKITVFEHGRLIEDFKVENNSWWPPWGDKQPSLACRGKLYLSESGEEVPDASGLGRPTGVFYGCSDFQTERHLGGYLKTLAKDAARETERGRPVYYLMAGDVVLSAKNFPLRLPQHEHLLWAPGNHCYQNHESLHEVVDFLQPIDGGVKFVVQYEEPKPSLVNAD